jgi:hypothetical protein
LDWNPSRVRIRDEDEMNFQKFIQVSSAILGIFYLSYSALEFYSWTLSLLTPSYQGIWAGLFLSGDIGWFIALFTVGTLMLGSAVKKPETYKGFSCLFVGSLLGVSLLGLQLLVVAAGLGDAIINFYLFMEEMEYGLTEGLLMPIVVGGIALIPLLIYTFLQLKKGGMAP